MKCFIMNEDANEINYPKRSNIGMLKSKIGLSCGCHLC